MMDADAVALRPSRCEEITIRGLRYNLRKWGRDGAKPILFVHGTQDSSISFQFVVDQLQRDWQVFAPDWRGHGFSEWASQAYWLHDFVADLDALVDTLFPNQKIPLVGHSLGGNVANVYAGLRSHRLTHLVSLDATGPMGNQVPPDMPKTLLRLLSHREATRRHTAYPRFEDMAGRLLNANPRLSRAKALFLAEHSSVVDDEGRRWRFDPVYEGSLPTLHSMEEWEQILGRIEVPVLWLVAQDVRPQMAKSWPDELARRSAAVPNLKLMIVPETGHNLHHDEPAQVAGLIESFIAGSTDEHVASIRQAATAT